MIFAGAGILLLVVILLDYPYWDYSDIEPTQMARGVRLSRDALVDLFERIESFFGRLEEYAEVTMTDAMRYIMVKIMVEVLGIFAIATNAIGRREANGLTPNAILPIADRDSEIFFKRLIGRTDIEDALTKLDTLTEEALKMAATQTPKLVRDIKAEVVVVAEEIQGVGDKDNQLIEGTFSTLAPHQCHLKPTCE